MRAHENYSTNKKFHVKNFVNRKNYNNFLFLRSTKNYKQHEGRRRKIIRTPTEDAERLNAITHFFFTFHILTQFYEFYVVNDKK